MYNQLWTYHSEICMRLQTMFIIILFKSTAAMDLKLDWLAQRRSQLVRELQECDGHEKEITNTLLIENMQKDKEINELKESLRGQTAHYEDELMKYAAQIKSLETVLGNKQQVMDSMKVKNEALSAENAKKDTTVQQKSMQILQLQHSLTVLRQNSERDMTEYKKHAAAREAEFHSELSKTVKTYEEKLSEMERGLIKMHEDELAQIKRNNLKLIEKIQSEYQQITVKSSESGKQREGDCARLVGENNKLLASLNDYKLRVVNLEANLNSSQQQARILQKEMEIFKENSRRETQFIKEERSELLEKNKRLADRVNQALWVNRENQLKKEEETKRIRKEIDASFAELQGKAEEEIRKMEIKNKEMSSQLQQKDQQIKSMQEICLKMKNLCESNEKQIQSLKLQIEGYQRTTQQKKSQGPSKSLEQLKNEVIRKNCQIQVLQDEVKRLKTKVNTIATTHEDALRTKQMMQRENKMLLSQIVFLRDKKGRDRKSESGFLSGMNSERSQICEDMDEYKRIINEMTEDMTEASRKLKEKDALIEKQRLMIERMERMLNM